jgi:16S rRNA (guanine1516-N2)-methyltransferase
LRETGGRLTLFAQHHPGFGGVTVDWSAPDLKRRIAAGRRQPLARAVGFRSSEPVTIFDATAGLGRDAFTLAALGAQVWAAERQEFFQQLLEDGRRRALANPASREAAERLHLCRGDARPQLAQGSWDTVYLDPMYPGHNRDASSKKELQFLRELTDGDPDADALLPMALAAARRRVVVKRPLKAPWLAAREPAYALKGTQARFDVYLTAPHPS